MVVPKVLVIQLKRFDNFQRKIKKFIKYEKELELSKYLKGLKEQTKVYPPQRYRLCSILIHEGFSVNSGHYYSYVKNGNSNSWYEMNDSSVSRLSEKSVQSQLPYILFYERVEERSLVPKEIKLPNLNREHVQLKEKPIQVNETNKSSELNLISMKKDITTFKNEKGALTQEPTPVSVQEVNIQMVSFDTSKIPSNFQSKKFRKMKKLIKLNKKANHSLIPKELSLAEDVDTGDQRTSTQDKSYSNKEVMISNEEIYYKEHDSHIYPSLPIRREESKTSHPNYYNPISEYKSFIYRERWNNPYQRNLSDLYGTDKVELWDTEEDSDLVKKQINFIKNSQHFKQKEVMQKDDYDIEYDKGKVKKIKKKTNSLNHSNYFQKISDRMSRSYY